MQAANHKRETNLISPRHLTARPRRTESQSERTLLSDVLYETRSTERNCGGILPSTTFSTNNYGCLIANVKGEFGAIIRFFASPPTCLPQGHFYRPCGKKIRKNTYAAEGEFRLPPIRNRRFPSDVGDLAIDRSPRPPARLYCGGRRRAFASGIFCDRQSHLIELSGVRFDTIFGCEAHDTGRALLAKEDIFYVEKWRKHEEIRSRSL